MFRQTKLIAALFLLAMLVLLIQAAPVMAAGMAVSPSSGGYGTTFSLFGDGFTPKEHVSVSIFSPNNVLVSSGTLTADSQGRIQSSAQIKSGTPAGKYTFVALGQSSHNQYSATFTVTGSSSQVSNTNTLASPGMVVSPTIGNYSTTFVLTAGGFNPGEPVSLWITGPTGSTVSPQTLYANNHGAIQVSGQVPYGYPSGNYTAYAQGQNSGHKYSSTFTLNVPIASFFPDWKGEYFNNRTLSGSPVVVRNDPAINFNWGLDPPIHRSQSITFLCAGRAACTLRPAPIPLRRRPMMGCAFGSIIRC